MQLHSVVALGQILDQIHSDLPREEDNRAIGHSSCRIDVPRRLDLALAEELVRDLDVISCSLLRKTRAWNSRLEAEWPSRARQRKKRIKATRVDRDDPFVLAKAIIWTTLQ